MLQYLYTQINKNISKILREAEMFAKKKLNLKRQDFIFENGWFDERVKMPGSMHMQQFQVSDCQQSEIYLLDSIAGAYIDDSKYCNVFLGPSESSVFIRNCHYLNIVCVVKQFRMRDCTNCRVWLWCQSQPIIQSSHGILFSAFPSEFGYGSIITQMKQAKLNVWNNNWFNIYDFTPIKFNKQNHKIVDTKPEQWKILNKMRQKIRQNGLQFHNQLIPFCQGIEHCITNGLSSYTVVVIYPVPDCGLGYPLLHSRIGKIGEEFKPFIKQIYIESLALFVKIKNPQIDKWKRLPEFKAKIIAILTEQKAKQVVQATVFVPFQDERV